MGSYVSISIYGKEEPEGWREDVDSAFAKIAEVESLTTSHNNRSEISRLAKMTASGHSRANEHVIRLLKDAKEIGARSDGALDVTILPVLKLWAFDSEEPKVPDKKKIAVNLALVDYTKIDLSGESAILPTPEMGVDLGAIAKGYAVDVAVEFLQTRGYRDLMVEAGGDLRAVAGETTRGLRTIWIRHPRNRKGFFASIKMDQGAVATSGDYERFFMHDGQRYHHILDPKTGYPAKSVVSVTIFAETTEFADAYATAVFVLGPKRGMDLVEAIADIEGLIVYTVDGDDSLRWLASSGIKNRININ